MPFGGCDPIEEGIYMRTVVAVIATALLVGATTATAQSLITSGNIQNNTIRSADVKNRSLTLQDFAPSARTALRGPRGPRGFQGPAGLQGAVGAPGRNGVTDVFAVDSPVVSVAPGTAGSATALCPPGSVATGGALGAATDVEIVPRDFDLINAAGFVVISFNPDGVAHNLQARAMCARQ
jgi:hypothetical protein